MKWFSAVEVFAEVNNKSRRYYWQLLERQIKARLWMLSHNSALGGKEDWMLLGLKDSLISKTHPF